MLLGMATIWGVNYSVVKFGTRTIDPLAYNATRIALAAACFLALAARGRQGRPDRRTLFRLIGLGMLGHGLYQVLFIEGLTRSRAGTAAIMLAASPAFIGILGRALGREHVTRRGWLGIALQIVGIVLVVSGTHAAASRGDSALGVALLLAGSLCWACFSVLVKADTRGLSSLHLGAWTVLGGALVVAPLGVPAAMRTDWAHIPPIVWGALLFSGLGALVLANLFWYRGVRALGPAHVAIFGNLQPLIALLFAWGALGEIPTTWQWLGAGSIMSGLLIARS